MGVEQRTQYEGGGTPAVAFGLPVWWFHAVSQSMKAGTPPVALLSVIQVLIR